MKWISRLSMRAAIPFAACCLLALVGVARAGDKTQLSGNWNFNSDQSDDAQRKVQEAQQNSQRGSAGRGYPGGGSAGGGYPGGGGIGGRYPGGGGMGGGGMGRPGGGGGDGRRRKGPSRRRGESRRRGKRSGVESISHESEIPRNQPT